MAQAIRIDPRSRTYSTRSTRKANAAPAFEMVVLGSGGGPFETDCAGYLLKTYGRPLEDGYVVLEGGALVNLLSHQESTELFPTLRFPPTHNTPILQAAYIFSYLSCYLLTHAHLDHCLSLIMLTGSLPPRIATHPSPNLSSLPRAMAPTDLTPTSGPSAPRPPVYGTRETLERLATAYDGSLWPELASWADVGASADMNKTTGVVLTPLARNPSHQQLHPLPVTVSIYPVAHGCTSKGLYESTAMFIRHTGREFLFFGDLESASEEIWQEAADSLRNGRLAAIFIECSYDSARPPHLMFGHISPPGLYRELQIMANLLDPPNLAGLRVYITHIKESLIPHPTGLTSRERIMAELRQLEYEGRIGVEFIEVKRGDRICEPNIRGPE